MIFSLGSRVVIFLLVLGSRVYVHLLHLVLKHFWHSVSDSPTSIIKNEHSTSTLLEKFCQKPRRSRKKNCISKRGRICRAKLVRVSTRSADYLSSLYSTFTANVAIKFCSQMRGENQFPLYVSPSALLLLIPLKMKERWWWTGKT